jgi:hypothetical protein
MPFGMRASSYDLANLLSSDAIKKSLCSLLDRQDLLQLRLVSTSITTSLSSPEYIGITFKMTNVSPRNLRPELRQSQQGLRGIGEHVRELVVKLCHHAEEDPAETLSRWGNFAPGAIFHGDGESNWYSTLADLAISTMPPRPLSLLSSSTQFPALEPATNVWTTDSDWPFVFHHLPNLETLTIITGQHPGGVCHTPISHALISLRVGFESSQLQKTTSLRFLPIHISYIPHFAFAGPSYGAATYSSPHFFSKIKTLELQIIQSQTPFSPLHNRQIYKTLQAFLRSYAKFLQVLKFHWVGAVVGPHLLRLDRELPRHHQSQSVILWPALREVWVGRVRGDDVRAEVHMLAPKLCKYMVLQVGWRKHIGYLEFSERSSTEVWDRVGKQEDPEEHDDGDGAGIVAVVSEGKKGGILMPKRWFSLRKLSQVSVKNGSLRSEGKSSGWSRIFGKRGGRHVSKDTIGTGSRADVTGDISGSTSKL